MEAREIGNVGAAYLANGETSKALECYREQLQLAKQMSDKVRTECYREQWRLARQMSDKVIILKIGSNN